MIYQAVELHNIEEVREVPGVGGVRLQRLPESLRVKLNEGAQLRTLSPACAEIRFVSDGAPARVTLSCPEGAADAVVFYGVFQSEERYAIGSSEQTIEIATPEPVKKLTDDLSAQMPFSPNVCRVMLAGDAVHLHGIDGGGIRPPRRQELPRLRYLAYGTSITHGARATGPHLTYAGQVARRLGADLINLGMGGSAHCEHELADYIAARDDWHFATLALSVNMVNGSFPPEVFYERVSYMVNTVSGADTSRPTACITIYPYYRDLGEQFLDEPDGIVSEEYRRKLRDAVAVCPNENVHLFEGPDILDDIAGLTTDLLHPADNGMIRMGENLAKKLAPIVASLR